MRVFCANCKKEISSKTDICPKCGEPRSENDCKIYTLLIKFLVYFTFAMIIIGFLMLKKDLQ